MDILAMILKILGVFFFSMALILAAFKLNWIFGIMTIGIVLILLSPDD